jgi:hypothetical protein
LSLHQSTAQAGTLGIRLDVEGGEIDALRGATEAVAAMKNYVAMPHEKFGSTVKSRSWPAFFILAYPLASLSLAQPNRANA